MMAFPILEVIWSDAWQDSELEDRPSEWKTICPVTTVGYLVRDGDVLSVAQEWVADGGVWRAVTHIPAPLVLSRRVLVSRDATPKITA